MASAIISACFFPKICFLSFTPSAFGIRKLCSALIPLTFTLFPKFYLASCSVPNIQFHDNTPQLLVRHHLQHILASIFLLLEYSSPPSTSDKQSLPRFCFHVFWCTCADLYPANSQNHPHSCFDVFCCWWSTAHHPLHQTNSQPSPRFFFHVSWCTVLHPALLPQFSVHSQVLSSSQSNPLVLAPGLRFHEHSPASTCSSQFVSQSWYPVLQTKRQSLARPGHHD